MRCLQALVRAALSAVLLAGCAVRPINPELLHYEPDAGYRLSNRPAILDNDPHTLLTLAFSGGGTRAAAFSYGVLEELRRTPVGAPGNQHTMLTEIDLISGVSGGSFTALAYALYGERLFDDYPQQSSIATSKESCSSGFCRRRCSPTPKSAPSTKNCIILAGNTAGQTGLRFRPVKCLDARN